MDTILLAITVVSIVAAIIMGATAWRLLRDERARSAARIAALAAAADQEGDLVELVERTPIIRPRVPVTPPWAPARVPAPLGDSFLGSGTASPAARGQRGLAIAAAILFVTLVVGGYFTIFGGDSPASAAASARADTPLELISLHHERQRDGLAITGLVRNPVSGTDVGKLAAVVLLFDQQGSFVTSSRADVDFTKLAPGDESPFVITLDAPSNVARYRVSFRNEAGVVPHIDRRGQEPIARDTP
jgi:hypothetical protein